MTTDDCKAVLKRPVEEGMDGSLEMGGNAPKMARVGAIVASWNE